MKIFVDTADLVELREAATLGVVSGVTTNPSLLAKQGGGDVKGMIQEICKLFPGCPVSMEVMSEDAEGMIREAEEFVTWGEGVCIKVPFGIEGMKAVSVLSKRGIPTNVTLIFSLPQVLLAAEAGATYISAFVGRLDDIGQDGMALIRQAVELVESHGYESQILAASIRGPLHVTQCCEAGAHVATIPLKVLKQSYAHPLTEKGIEQFKTDWAKRQG
ncbi:MAG: fructose-6-phosphate aldolase [Vampirovibrionales bacterium]